jgi:hypothetical protein
LSFNDTLDDLKSTLEGNTGLAAFCTAQFGKNHTVKRVFKKRTEISIDELPIVLITRPDVTPEKWRPTEREYTHNALVYCGFYCEDREAAQDILVEFEELMEAAILTYKNPSMLPEGITDIDPKAALNDEGYYHPVYFFVKAVEIQETRQL